MLSCLPSVHAHCLSRCQLSEASAPVKYSPQRSLMRTPGVSPVAAPEPQVKTLHASLCVCAENSTTLAKTPSFEPIACGGIISADQIHKGSPWHRKPRLCYQCQNCPLFKECKVALCKSLCTAFCKGRENAVQSRVDPEGRWCESAHGADFSTSHPPSTSLSDCLRRDEIKMR